MLFPLFHFRKVAVVPRPLRPLLAVLALALAVGLAACGGSDENASSTTGTTAQAVSCTKQDLKTFADGKLTVGTDQPAFPPYFVDNDPSNGKGFESAVAYAIAQELGFAKDEVDWTVVPFNSSYAPGPKKFDFDVNQISITPQREKVVDFSSPYYTAPQAVLARKGTAPANAKSLEDLSDVKLGVQVGTTSLQAVSEVIKPNQPPQVFNDSNDLVAALKSGRIDAIVVDLPTAIYLRDAVVSDSVVAGQFDLPGGGDRWGALLAKDSKLAPCVNKAVNALRNSGQLEAITQQWMSQYAKAPELQ
jgi:polar amino acid transport system substrate-binding protein